MFYMLIFLFFLYTFLKIALEMIELKFVKSEHKKEPVILEKDDFIEAGKISIENKKFDIFTILYEFMIVVFWLSFGLKFMYENLVADDTVLENLLFVMSFIVVSTFLNLPLEIYSKFVKDKRFGFSTIDKKTFTLDFIKSFLLTIVFGSLIVWLLILCINFLGFSWWFWAALLSFGIILIINFLYPTLIAPLFNKMEVLENEDLKTSIEALMEKCGFKSSGIYTIDASKRDNRLNAYFGGFGSSKRVVLFDTLIKKLTKEEIMAVLGHELGHFKNKDILRILIFSAIMLLFTFGVLGNLPNSLFEDVGVKKNSGTIIVMIMILSNLLSFIITPIQSNLSRQREFKADKFGSDLQDEKSMISALKKLGSENKAFPKSSKIYSSFYHSHPTLYERVNKLENR